MSNNEVKSVREARPAKHTPGPWTVEKSQKWDGDRFVTAKGFIVRTGQPGNHMDEIRVGSSGGPEDVVIEDEANARLMAAAPELLAVCQSIIDDREACGIDESDSDDPMVIILKAARAAVAKAVE